MTAPGVREETVERLRYSYKASDSAVMTDTSLVRAGGVRITAVVSPLIRGHGFKNNKDQQRTIPPQFPP